MSSRPKILKLYKELLKESANFKSYYYKNYFIRKTKAQLRKHLEADEATSNELVKKSEEMLAMLKRQTMITNAYEDSRLVIEKSENEPQSQNIKPSVS